MVAIETIMYYSMNIKLCVAVALLSELLVEKTNQRSESRIQQHLNSDIELNVGCASALRLKSSRDFSVTLAS